MKTQTEIKTKVEVYDPAMCCSTGICGPEVDDALVDFANDVKWLKARGVEVQRYNLGQEPEAFKSNPDVITRIKNTGIDVLPIILRDGKVVSEGGYPNRDQLKEMLGLSDKSARNNGTSTEQEILVTLEEAVSTGDEDTMRNQFGLGKQQGVDIQKLVSAIQTGVDNRQMTTQKLVQTANELLGQPSNGCGCGSGGCC